MKCTFPVSADGLAAAFSCIEDSVETAGLPKSIAHRLCVILDEVLSNLIRHGSAAGDGGEFEIELAPAAARTHMTIRTPGAPFDPLAAPTAADTARVGPGGHGLAIIRGLASNLAYAHQDGINCLAIEIDVAGIHGNV